MQKISVREKFMLMLLCGLAYLLIDTPVQMTGVLPSFAGIKNFLPATLVLFFGVYGVLGCIAGCVLSSLIVNPNVNAVLYECWCIAATGLVMFYGWHALSRHHRISLKTPGDYVRYISLLMGASLLCGKLSVGAAYFLTGLFIGVPINILFSSILYIDEVLPSNCSYDYDASFTIGAGSLDEANEILESAADERGIKMKQVFEIESCIEEFTIRIFGTMPDAHIDAGIIFGEAISVCLSWPGEKYNPLMIHKDEDEIDVMSLKIIKHRALRASYTYSHSMSMNRIHVVI